MATRIRIDLNPEAFGRLVEAAVAERRPAFMQAEVLLLRALGLPVEPAVPQFSSVPPSEKRTTRARRLTPIDGHEEEARVSA